MKKYLKYILLILIALPMVACGKEENDDPANENPIIGEWEVISNTGDPGDWEKPCIFNFRENGRLTVTFSKGLSAEESVLSHYSTEGSNIRINWILEDKDNYDEWFEGTYKISGKMLTLELLIFDWDSGEFYGEDILTLKKL